MQDKFSEYIKKLYPEVERINMYATNSFMKLREDDLKFICVMISRKYGNLLPEDIKRGFESGHVPKSGGKPMEPSWPLMDAIIQAEIEQGRCVPKQPKWDELTAISPNQLMENAEKEGVTPERYLLAVYNVTVDEYKSNIKQEYKKRNRQYIAPELFDGQGV